ncbi:hypothetical protein UY3_14540 [Chelonia mydas]|uniref:Uncharacterized protein n=1 Tax=Chelonia mydas TaxID=8469 RepID=M7B882_CHEMY|nr:hypothetical protein UY3_14540 [Chelonia mydas]
MKRARLRTVEPTGIATTQAIGVSLSSALFSISGAGKEEEAGEGPITPLGAEGAGAVREWLGTDRLRLTSTQGFIDSCPGQGPVESEPSLVPEPSGGHTTTIDAEAFEAAMDPKGGTNLRQPHAPCSTPGEDRRAHQYAQKADNSAVVQQLCAVLF